MKLGLLGFEVNRHRIASFGSETVPSPEGVWAIIGLRVPSIHLPFYRRNTLGEWERTLAVSFPTVIQITNISGISWEFHVRVLGFGCSLEIQYGC